MSRSVVVAAVLALAPGCAVYTVNRAAEVPHMTPSLRSGAPMTAPAEVQVGASSVAQLGHIEGDPDAAVEVPGTQLEGAARLRIGHQAAIGLVYADGLDSTAQQGKETQPRVDGGDVRGYGMSLHGMVKTHDPRWRVGLGFEALTWDIPYVEYATCIMNCGGVPYTVSARGHAHIGQIGMSIAPTYTSGRFSVFGGLTARNHPTIDQKALETDPGHGHVEGGPMNLVLSAGFEADLGAGVRASLILYSIVAQAPVSYPPPGLAATLTIPLGPRDAPPPAAPAATRP